MPCDATTPPSKPSWVGYPAKPKMAALLGCGCFPPSPLLCLHSPAKFSCRTLRTPPLLLHRPFSAKPISRAIARSTQKYVYPDPNPQFAQYETNKFRTELRKKLSKEKETFGDALDEVVEVCSENDKSYFTLLGFICLKKGFAVVLVKVWILRIVKLELV
ncbi:hypothetical protein Tsubulata_030939 [Turnera subulata]|uniref:Uncharacterized protein n=1 Tax=Turnera subulata TaxID=218843 RepID=A0A9Q0GAM7_9ROSI|nr:hypothetical protein Tsubulata_030939 [Turnera subulata]